jgi:long-chain acyl-CoA synthetase
MVYGDRKPYLTCVLTLDPEELGGWFQDKGLECPTGDNAWSRICEHPAVVEAITGHIESVNGTLARYQTLKKWQLLPCIFDVDGGYLTPTMKMKRRVIIREFQATLEGFYTS